MGPLRDFRFLLRISGSHAILRRYVVVNGFDGALTMLGLLMGFRVAPPVPPGVVITACLGAAVALGASGLSSAFISEAAERRRALRALEEAMMRDMEASAHGRATRLVPYLIAASNGLSPLLLSLLIISPLWATVAGGVVLPLPPLDSAIALAFVVVFLLGAYLGHVGKTSWLGSGMHALLIALATMAMIVFLERNLSG